MEFECPVCQKALQKTTYEGTSTYPCPNGCGAFLGRNNLRIIEESRETSIPMASVPKSGDERGSVKACPKCKGEMAKRNYGELDSTVIDYCASCQGIWLDPGELERIQVFYEAANDFNEARENPAAAPAFACPECQTQQLQQAVCINCGLVFAKHLERKQERQARQAAGAATADARSGNGRQRQDRERTETIAALQPGGAAAGIAALSVIRASARATVFHS